MRLTKPIVVESNHDTFIVKDRKNADKLKSKGFGFEIAKDIYGLMPYEVLYLLEKNNIEVYEMREELSYEQILKKDGVIFDEYVVFKDLTKKGYLVRTGLKFGFTFRLYRKRNKFSRDHSLWLVYVIKDSDSLSAKTLASLGRISHSTKKKSLIAVVDSQKSVTYYEYEWSKI